MDIQDKTEEVKEYYLDAIDEVNDKLD